MNSGILTAVDVSLSSKYAQIAMAYLRLGQTAFVHRHADIIIVKAVMNIAELS